MGEREFIMEAIDKAKQLVERTGFEQIKTKDIIDSLGVSKTKFFYYFGGLYGIMELMIHHELAKLYTDLEELTKRIASTDELIACIIDYRRTYIKQNKVLNQYYKKRNYRTARFNALNKSIAETEAGFLKNYILQHPFSTKQKTELAYQIQFAEKGVRGN